MNPRVRFEPDAAAEFDEAAMWLEQRSAGLGMRFIDAVDRAVAAITSWPNAGSPVPGVDADVAARRVPVGRFPYQLIHLVDGDLIRVLAIAHDRRRPRYWRASET